MHFISVASDKYSPAIHQKIWYDLDLNYLWPPHQGRSIPLGEILLVLASNSGDYTKANLLYGVCEITSLFTMYDEKVVLPMSEFKAHTSFNTRPLLSCRCWYNLCRHWHVQETCDVN